MKSIALLFMLAHVLSSCVTYKNLTKHETITPEFLAGLKLDKKYVFELKNGVRQVVKITQIKDSTITGLTLDKTGDGKKWIDYSATFDSMEKGVAKISVKKVNPYLTGAGVLVVALVTTAIIWANTAW